MKEVKEKEGGRKEGWWEGRRGGGKEADRERDHGCRKCKRKEGRKTEGWM